MKKILVHSCGETHVFHDCKSQLVGGVDELRIWNTEEKARFRVWDWWREIEEDSDVHK